MATVRAGQRYGQWAVAGEEPLGAGGNGEVWRAEAADGRSGAIKILSGGRGPGGCYRLGRFRDEISSLIAHPDTRAYCPCWTAESAPIPARPPGT